MGHRISLIRVCHRHQFRIARAGHYSLCSAAFQKMYRKLQVSWLSVCPEGLRTIVADRNVAAQSGP